VFTSVAALIIVDVDSEEKQELGQFVRTLNIKERREVRESHLWDDIRHEWAQNFQLPRFFSV
jgi:hypothetical protein